MLLQMETQTWVLIVEGPVTCFLCRCVETEASALESSILLPYDVCSLPRDTYLDQLCWVWWAAQSSDVCFSTTVLSVH